MTLIPPSYAEARAQFLGAARAKAATLEHHAIPTADGGDLTVDVAIFGADRPRAVVFSSGVHGVEGYLGSAVQRAILARGWPEDLRVVFIHAVNPYGMAHHRRVNESNVDLNRNFLFEGETYEGCPEGYRALQELINPEGPAPASDPWFLLRAGAQILRHGLPALRQAFAGGQYEFPRGCFFGGAKREQSTTVVMEGLSRWLAGAERVLHVDYHVGRGARGASVVYATAAPDTPAFHDLRSRFGATLEPWQTTGKGTGYSARGTFPSAIERLLGPDRVVSLTQEVGTVHDLRIAQALVQENRAHHHGGAVAESKRAILEAFHPPDAAWQAAGLQIGLDVASRAVEHARA